MTILFYILYQLSSNRCIHEGTLFKIKLLIVAGQKELKVFVDLAMMSAGDEPMNIAKVQCLHSAAIGYSPLIFDLNLVCSYESLLEMFQSVFTQLQSNPKLPDHLVSGHVL